MKIEASTPDEYALKVPKERQEAYNALRSVILENLPKGCEEMMSYGLPGFVVPYSLYPDGYHCKPSEPLPFMGMANQKNFLSFYHMGMYADETLSDWFASEYPKHSKRKLDMGKSCVRFKYMNDIPYKLIGELVAKMSVEEWIDLYERNIKR